jgi:hypothetical protein
LAQLTTTSKFSSFGMQPVITKGHLTWLAEGECIPKHGKHIVIARGLSSRTGVLDGDQSHFLHSFHICQHIFSFIMPTCSISPPAVTLPSGGKRRLLPVVLLSIAVFINCALGMENAQDPWTTARLSVARAFFSATSVENEALFAGGSIYIPSAFLCWKLLIDCGIFSVIAICALQTLACSLMHTIAGVGNMHTDVVDLYNGATRAWSTARLSVARTDLAITSVRNVALFAGGLSLSKLVFRLTNCAGVECSCCLRVNQY